jgi:flagellar biosynthesis GTPase FlhF
MIDSALPEVRGQETAQSRASPPRPGVCRVTARDRGHRRTTLDARRRTPGRRPRRHAAGTARPARRTTSARPRSSSAPPEPGRKRRRPRRRRRSAAKAKEKEREKAAKAKEKERTAKQKEREKAAKAKEKERASEQKEERAAKGKDKADKRSGKDSGRPAGRGGSTGPGRTPAGTRKGPRRLAGAGGARERVDRRAARQGRRRQPLDQAPDARGVVHDARPRRHPHLGREPRRHPRRRAGHRRRREQPRLLRIEFRDEQDRLEEVDWDAFFATFDESDVDFLYQEYTKDGGESRFLKIVRAGD